MKIINVSEGPVFLEDVGQIIPSDTKFTVHEIPDFNARTSKALKYALSTMIVIDVTNKTYTKADILSWKQQFKTMREEAQNRPNPSNSPYMAKKSILSSDDHSAHSTNIEPEHAVSLADYAKPAEEEQNGLAIAYSGPACFPAGVSVLTTDGIIPIEQIQVGQDTFTANGRYRKVVQNFKRLYKGPLVVVKTFLNNEQIKMTENHKVLAIKELPCKSRKSFICKPSCNTQYSKVKRSYGQGIYNYCVNQPYKNYIVEEIAAKDLDSSCFLLMPKGKVETTNTTIVLNNHLGKYQKFSYNKEIIWPSPESMTTCKTTISRNTDIPLSIIYRKDLSERLQKRVDNVLCNAELEYDPIARQGIAIPNEIPLSYDFGRFVGLYIAKGSTGKGVISISLHEKEKDTANFVIDFTKRIFGLNATIKAEPEKHGQSVCIHSIILKHFLKLSCGNKASYKRIPSWAFNAPKDFLSGLIRGIWEGHGNKECRKKDNTIKFATASKSLVYQVQYLLGMFGVVPSIEKSEKTENKFRDKVYKYVIPKPLYNLRISGQQLYKNEWLLNFQYNRPHKLPNHSRERNYFVLPDYIAVKIYSVRREQFEGDVYNIEVEEDHSYLVNGKCVKNCDGGGYARMNRKFMFGLQERGVKVRYDPVPSFEDMDQETTKKLNALKKVRVPKSSLKIYGQTAPLIWDWSMYRMLFTMMETRQLHPMYVDRCNSADEIIVPTKWCYEVFKESGVKRPISVVPLGIDEKIYHEDVEPLSFNFPLKDYVFISVFGWSLRKGYDVLIKAYLEEFTSDEPVSLLISSRFFGSTDESKKKRIREDFAKVARLVKNPKKPQVVLYGDVLSDEMMPRLYSASDCYVLISRGEGFGLPYCFPAGTRISTPNGFSYIENIKYGDLVLTHSGQTKMVLRKMNRQYSGDLISIRALMYNKEIKVTPEHPILAIKKIYKRSNDKRHAEIKPEWIQAKDLKKGDLLVIPKPKLSKSNIQTLDLAVFLKDKETIDFDNKYIWSRYSNRPSGITCSKISENSGVSKRSVYRVIESKNKLSRIKGLSEKKRTRIVLSMDRLGYENNNCILVRRFVDINEEMGELVGWYASEGSLSPNAISFSFHSNEKDYHNRVKVLMSKIFGIDKFYERADGNKYEIIFSSAIVSEFFNKICGKGAVKKSLSSEMTESTFATKLAFLDSFRKGDGCIWNIQTSLSITMCTSSEKLAYQIWQMLLECGYSASFLAKSLRKNRTSSREYVLQYSESEPLEHRRRRFYTKTIKTESAFYCQIIKTEKIPYNGSVFNFEVEDENSYCANGFAVHNCEAAACGIPVIGSRYSGQTDFLADDNSYLVDVDGFAKADPSLSCVSQFYEDAEFPLFGPKAVEQTRYFMRRAFENRDEANIKAQKLKDLVLNNYTWDKCVDCLLEKIKETYGRIGAKP